MKLLGHNKGNHLQNLGVGKVSQTGHQGNTLKRKDWQVLLFIRSVMSSSLRPHGLQHSWLPCPSLSPRVCSNSCPLSRWCHPTILPSVVPFSSWPQSFPASGTFPVSQLLASGGQNIGASASASVLPTNIQALFPLRLTGLISLQCKRLSRVFSNTTVQSISFSMLSLFYGPTLTSIRDYWKSHSFNYTNLVMTGWTTLNFIHQETH